MTSGKQARRQRQVERPPVRSTEGRRASPTVLLAALGGLVVIAVAVVLAVVLLGNSSGSTSTVTNGTTLPDAGTIATQFDGIPQHGNVLGNPSAPVTMVEYVDLQCPICRQFETEVMPTILTKYVRAGKLRVEARPIAFIGPDSERGRRGTIAAGDQNHAFDFMQLLYFNQGPENGGWLSQSMVADAATSIQGLNVKTLVGAMTSKSVADQETAFDRQAKADAVSGTPTLLVGKTGTKLKSLGAGAPTAAALGAVIDAALK